MISIDKDSNACICADGSHGVHSDGRGHSGMVLIMGKGDITILSKKFGLSTVSST